MKQHLFITLVPVLFALACNPLVSMAEAPAKQNNQPFYSQKAEGDGKTILPKLTPRREIVFRDGKSLCDGKSVKVPTKDNNVQKNQCRNVASAPKKVVKAPAPKEMKIVHHEEPEMVPYSREVPEMVPYSRPTPEITYNFVDDGVIADLPIYKQIVNVNIHEREIRYHGVTSSIERDYFERPVHKMARGSEMIRKAPRRLTRDDCKRSIPPPIDCERR